MFCLGVCLSVHRVLAGPTEATADFLEQELPMVVSHLVGTRNHALRDNLLLCCLEVFTQQ